MSQSHLDNLYFIGPMGCGKTTIGKKLARKINYEFFDSDEAVESKTGATVATIFEMEGEEGFRRREQEIIAELTRKKGIVLSTGGGAILNEDNRQRLSENGFVVYLKASEDLLLSRIAGDHRRPLMKTDDPLGKIRELLQVRGPIYEETADLIVTTDGCSINQIINKIYNTPIHL